MGIDTVAIPKTRLRAAASGGYPPARATESMNGEQERVLLEHLPIVRFLARRIHERLPQHVDIEDLVSAGIVGLMDAFTKFDPQKKVQFRSYAQFRIRGAILDSLRTLDWGPRDLRRKGREAEEAIRALTGRLGRSPGEAEVAAEMGVSLEEYQSLLGDLKGLEIGTLHVEHNDDSGEEELAYVPGRPDEDPLFCCLRGELQDKLRDAIENLPRTRAPGDDSLLLRGTDHARDWSSPWSRGIPRIADSCFGRGAPAGSHARSCGARANRPNYSTWSPCNKLGQVLTFAGMFLKE